MCKDLYGNDVTSAHELLKGYTRPIYKSLSFTLLAYIRKRHVELVAVQKIIKALRAEANNKKLPDIEDLILKYCERAVEKYGKKSGTKPVAAINCAARMVPVLAPDGKNLRSAFECICDAVRSDFELAILVQSATDTCSNSLQNAIDDKVAHFLDRKEANFYTEPIGPDGFRKTLEPSMLIPCGDANLNIDSSDNGNQSANLHSTTMTMKTLQRPQYVFRRIQVTLIQSLKAIHSLVSKRFETRRSFSALKGYKIWAYY